MSYFTFILKRETEEQFWTKILKYVIIFSELIVMRKNALEIIVVQGGGNLILDYSSNILSDYGVSIVKTADNLKSSLAYISDPNLNRNKILSKEELMSDKFNSVLEKAKGLLLHEDMPNLENNIVALSKKYPHLIILTLYRISHSFSSKQGNKKPHDVNIQALSSILSEFGQTDNVKDNSPQYPSVIASLVAANMAAIMLLNALYSRHLKVNSPSIIHLSILQASMFLNTFNLNSHLNGMIKGPRGTNILDGNAPFYRIYETKDDYLAVGNLQTKFYEEMLSGMELQGERLQYLQNNQMNEEDWPKMKQIFEKEFKKKTTKQWMAIFSLKDTCISEVGKLAPASEIVPWPRLSRHEPYPKL